MVLPDPPSPPPNTHSGQAVEGPLTATDGNVAVFDGPSGDKIKDGGPFSGGGITNSAPSGTVPVTSDGDGNLAASTITDDGANTSWRPTTSIDLWPTGPNGTEVFIDDSGPTVRAYSKGDVILGDISGGAPTLTIDKNSNKAVDIQAGETGDTALRIRHTWNDAGVAFDGLYIDITDTLSNAASDIIFAKAGLNSFEARKDGSLFLFHNGNLMFSVDASVPAVVQPAPAATTAGLLDNGQISFYLDEAGNKLKVAVKYSDGTTKTGEVVLT